MFIREIAKSNLKKKIEKNAEKKSFLFFPLGGKKSTKQKQSFQAAIKDIFFSLFFFLRIFRKFKVCYYFVNLVIFFSH